MSINFKVIMNLDNAAFQDRNTEMETARILREIADKIENGDDSLKIYDINGNSIGSWGFYTY